VAVSWKLRRVEFDRAKFKALVHYVIWKAGAKPGFGATKLNKVLWFADAKSFVLTGKPITGAKYIRERWGPVPHQIVPVRIELESEGVIRVWTERYHDRSTTKFKALVPPSPGVFTSGELQTINYWISYVADEHTAASISEESHDYAWEIAKEGEEIPYYAFLVNRLRPSKGHELEWAREEARRLGLT
jgi:Protein of unknown function (DUF4065)